jgi:hypothetical protein
MDETVLTIFDSEHFGSSPLGLPKCEIKTQLPPSDNICSIVGFAASILVVSVTSILSFNGTLKSTRIIAR